MRLLVFLRVITSFLSLTATFACHEHSSPTKKVSDAIEQGDGELLLEILAEEHGSDLVYDAAIQKLTALINQKDQYRMEKLLGSIHKDLNAQKINQLDGLAHIFLETLYTIKTDEKLFASSFPTQSLAFAAIKARKLCATQANILCPQSDLESIEWVVNNLSLQSIMSERPRF